MDLQSIRNIYIQKNFEYSANEQNIINFLYKKKEWDSLDDKQKISKREVYLRDFNKFHISDKRREKIFKYELSVFQLLLKINIFLEGLGNDDNQDNILFRIKSMLFCEKEFINLYEKLKRIGHIPFFVFEPLIKEVQHTEEYKKYKLDELFEEYEKMYQLFLEKPYEEK